MGEQKNFINQVAAALSTWRGGKYWREGRKSNM